jgi:hypothetical protein
MELADTSVYTLESEWQQLIIVSVEKMKLAVTIVLCI